MSRLPAGWPGFRPDGIALQAVLPHEFAFSWIMFDRNRDIRDDLAIT